MESLHDDDKIGVTLPISNTNSHETTRKTYYNVNDEECAVCLDGSSYEGNEIIFCDKCNVPVHRGCYGVVAVPDGSWFCDLCAQGGDPSTTKCRLCPFTCGAYKATENPNEWVHALCAMWIPEIYCPDSVNMPNFVIGGVDKARYRLKCGVCGTKHGACLQCAYGRCITSAHPSCALDRRSGYTSRIIKNPDNPGTMDWDIFCIQHATSVKDNLKKKCNSKRAQIVDHSNNDDIGDGNLENGFDSGRRMKGGKAMRQQSRSTQDEANQGEAPIGDTPRKVGRPRGRPPKGGHKDASNTGPANQGGTSSSGARGRSSGRVRNRRRSRSEYSDEDNGEEDSDESVYEEFSTFYGGDMDDSDPIPTSASGHAPDDGTRPTAFPVHLMSEWPGQTIGEAMDLEHFWNVTSMLYPEDQSEEWLEAMSRTMLDPSPLPDEPNPLGKNPSSHFDKLVHQCDEAYLAVGSSDRDRLAALDFEKRQQLIEAALSHGLDLLTRTSTQQGSGTVCESKGVAIEEPVSQAQVTLKELPAVDAQVACGDVSALDSIQRQVLTMAGTEEHLLPETKAVPIPPTTTEDHIAGSIYSSTLDRTLQESQTRSRSSGRDSLAPPTQPLVSRTDFEQLPTCLRSVAYGLMDEYSFMLRRSAKKSETSDVIEIFDESVDENENQNNNELQLKLAIDGSRQRALCEFAVRVLSDENSQTASDDDDDWQKVQLDSISDGEKEWKFHHLLRGNEYMSSVGRGSDSDVGVEKRGDEPSEVDICLRNFHLLPNSESVTLPTSAVVARDEDDELCRMIRTDTEAYRFCMNAVNKRAMELLTTSGIRESIRDRAIQRQNWTTTEEQYVQQRIWKRIAVLLIEGMKDQRPDFNKEAVEVVPASWTLRVDGRPKPEDKKEKDKEKEKDGKDKDEDLICMCCFNGTSVDGNEILYCDGCNCPMHQSCYGVPEIPEGDFFCNRCRMVQQLADEMSQEQGTDLENPRDIAKCCLCPVYHGGLKPTTDGRWVHLCCAWWCGQAVIENLIEMEPIDISRVVSVPTSDGQDDSRRGRGQRLRTLDSRRSRSPFEYEVDESLAKNQLPLKINALTLVNSELQRLEPQLTMGSGIGLREGAVESVAFAASAVVVGEHFGSKGFHNGDVTSSFDLQLSKSLCATAMSAVVVNNDIEGISKDSEPVLKKVQSLQKSLRCYICHTSSGYITTCADECCGVAFHPLCGWFQGLFVKAEVLDPSFCQFLETRGNPDVAYPASGLSFKFMCDQHCPAEGGSPAVRREQALLRGKYCISVDDLDYLPGQQRRRKKKRMAVSASVEGSTKAIGPGTVANQGRVANASANRPKDLEPDSYTPSQCAACLQPVTCPVKRETEFAIEDSPVESYENSVMKRLETQQCSKCKIVVHTCCYPQPRAQDAEPVPPSNRTEQQLEQPVEPVQENTLVVKAEGIPTVIPAAVESANPLGGWVCAPCKTDEVDIRCALCPRRGGALLQTGDGRFAHVFCGRHAPGMTRVSNEGRVEIRLLPKDSKKLKCGICNRKNGASVRCKAVGCTAVFHPHCAERSGKYYITIRQGYSMTYCPEHIPEGVSLLRTGQWVDLNEMRKLRNDMDNARELINLMLQREEKKASLYNAYDDVFARRAALLLERLKRLNGPPDSQQDTADFSDDESVLNENLSQPLVDAQPVITTVKKRGRPKVIRPDSIEGGNDMNESLIPSPAEEFATEKPKGRRGRKVGLDAADAIDTHENLAVSVSGQIISRTFVSLDLQKDEFMLEVQREIHRTVTANRKQVGIFPNERAAKDFRLNLGPHVDSYLVMSLSKAKQALAKTLVDEGRKLSTDDEHEEVDAEEAEAEADVHVEVAPTEAIRKRGRPAGRSRLKTLSEAIEVVPDSDENVTKSGPEEEHLSLKLRVTPKAGRGSTSERVAESLSSTQVPVAVSDDEQPETGEKLIISISKKGRGKRAQEETSGEPPAAVEELTEPTTRKYKKSDVANSAAVVSPFIPFLLRRYKNDGDDGDPCSELMRTCHTAMMSIPGTEKWNHKGKNTVKEQQEILSLEGRIQDMINALEDAQEEPPKKVSSTKSSKSSSAVREARKSRQSASLGSSESMVSEGNNEQQQEPRLLGDAFSGTYDGPRHNLANISHPYTFDEIKAKLMKHQYRSWAAFERDVVDMFNEAREGDFPGTPIMADTQALMEILNSSKPTSNSGRLYITAIPLKNHKSSQSVDPALHSAECCFCGKNYIIEHWPETDDDVDADSMTNKKNKNKRTSPRLGKDKMDEVEPDKDTSSTSLMQWAWSCPHCVVNPKHCVTLPGRAVKAWWSADKAFYLGRIGAFEPDSKRHQILYDDGTFELIEVNKEPVLIEKLEGDVSEASTPVVFQPTISTPAPETKPAGKKDDVDGQRKRKADNMTGTNSEADKIDVKTAAPAQDYKPIPKKKKADTDAPTVVPPAVSVEVEAVQESSAATTTRRGRSSGSALTSDDTIVTDRSVSAPESARPSRGGLMSGKQDILVGKQDKIIKHSDDGRRSISSTNSRTGIGGGGSKKQTRIDAFVKKS